MGQRRADDKRMFARALLMLVLVFMGCAAPKPSITDPDASGKIVAMKQGVEKKDRAIIGPLIDDLNSDDPAVRLYSIQALQRLTGQDFGYRYFDDAIQRQPAIQRWRDWMERQP